MSCFWTELINTEQICSVEDTPIVRGTVWVARDSARTWNCIAMPRNGQYILAGVLGGYLYYSSNFGVTFTQLTSSGSRNWTACCVSDNGQIIYGADFVTKELWKSSDAGSTFVALTASHLQGDGGVFTAIVSIDCSSSGNIIVVGQDLAGYVWTSDDGGYSFIHNTTISYDSSNYGRWNSVRISKDGTFVIAWNDYTAQLFIGSTGGTLTSQNVLIASGDIQEIAMSDNNLYTVLADSNTGYIYTSSNAGVTFIQRSNAGIESIDLDTSGRYVIGSYINGTDFIKLSSDYGVTFEDSNSGAKLWGYVRSSADGTRLVSFEWGGQIWTSSE
jgi:hypothetical protein